MKISIAGFISGCMVAACPALVHAQAAADYPTKPVRVIVPFPPGGSTDVLARLAGSFLEGRFKQPFVMENRPGAATQIGTDAVVKSPNDGYTLLVTSINVASEQALSKEWPIRFERDLTPVAMFVSGGYAIVASNNLPITNLRELIAYSKANPGKLNQAESAGISTDIAILKHQTGAGPIESILYKGGPAAIQAVVAGEAHFFGASVLDAAPLARAGKLKVIAYSEKERHPMLPDVPTVGESGVGVNDFDASYWFALFGPSGLPPEIVAKLSAAMLDLVKSPEFTKRVTQYGMRAMSLRPAEVRERIATRIKLLEQMTAQGVKLR